MRKALLPLLLVTGLAFPAAAQIDFSRFVQLGDSLTAGYLDACWVEHGQRNDYGALLANLAGVDFQQPLLKEPGVGGAGLGPGKGCLVLTNLVPAPTFTHKDSVLVPLNLNLPRPYSNLAVPGYTTRDVVDAKSAADNGNPLTDVVLRGLGTALQQAEAQHPTFATVFIGNNDVLPAVLTGTAIDGVTMTSLTVVVPKLDELLHRLSTAQGTAKGVVMTLPDPATIPFVTAIPPVVTVGGHVVTDPATGAPMTYLSQKVEKFGGVPTGNLGPVAPIPATSLLTLYAADYIATGFGIPCSVFTAAGVPAGDPRRANCDKPLPDDVDPVANTPGVVLFPDEVADIEDHIQSINDSIGYLGPKYGFAVYDANAFFADFHANGRSIAGIDITADFLSGGFFSYDGIHPTSLGQAIFTRDLIVFLNQQFHANLPDVDLSPYLAGVSGAGGALRPDAQQTLDVAAALCPVALWPQMKGAWGLIQGPWPVQQGDAPPPRPDRDRDWRH